MYCKKIRLDSNKTDGGDTFSSLPFRQPPAERSVQQQYWRRGGVMRRAVHLRPIWTIMVAAKLDQSRVLVTKFRQNRLMLKGRSAGQRHTDRQTRLKIMALQVCNRANRTDNGTIAYRANCFTNGRPKISSVVAAYHRTSVVDNDNKNCYCVRQRDP